MPAKISRLKIERDLMTILSGPAAEHSGHRDAAGGHRYFSVRPMLKILRDQFWFIAVALLYMLIAFAVTQVYGQKFSVWLYSRLHLALYLNLAVAFLVVRIFRTLRKHRPERPLRFVWNDLMGDYRVPRRILNALPALALLPFTLSASTSIKRLIPTIAPFDWDGAFARIDALVHGGYQPWELLQPLLGDPVITGWIDFAYASPWFWMLVGMQFWQTFTLDPRRVQFLVTFVLCWALLGNVLAIFFSSVGPVYFANFVDGPNPYAPLMAYLDSLSASSQLIARSAQEYLWEKYVTHDLTAGVGISAMPSLHISMGFLFVLLCWRAHWALRALSTTYLIILLIGSVHLGWHYAIDGYVSILATAFIWWAVGRALIPRSADNDP